MGDKKLRKFFDIQDVPEALQVSEFISRFKAESYIKMVNSILMAIKPLKKCGKRTFTVDATPIKRNYNTRRKYRSK